MIHSEKAIGLFGGTFDPVHIGHLIVAEWLSEVLKIKTTYFIPAKIHPFVSKSNISSSDNRIEMLSLALKEYPDFKISDVEIKRQEVSYTIDTIKFFKDEFPDSELYFYMGMDNLNTLEQWKDPNEILKMCYVVVYNRGIELKAKDWLEHPKVIHVDSPLIEISSSHIRHRIKKGMAYRSLVPNQVFEYINQKRLYLY
ncbi:MAG: nicotinate (nicotinamide) nucleotide adenylyltransferase [Calditrichae bacterium]|nr:nicotinate (nicotinamide) nucleotide adenylyltransferase [Calditrichota bacterium]MCB9058993.1 nicotinate (nicotinamide) nucleotide adenylyltransferase [Calditrichia bacterium]